MPRRILPVLAAVLIAAIVGMRLNISANNDVYLQLLAAEGLTQGNGYGFHDGGRFYSIGARRPETRWPPGITVLTALIWGFAKDPLVVLARLQPLLAGMSFYFIYLAFRRRMSSSGVALAAVGAALTSTVYFYWHTEVSSEPWFFVALAILLWQLRSSGTRNVWMMVPTVWAMVMFRTAGAYIAGGLAVLIFLAGGRGPWFKAALRAGGWLLLFVLPLAAFHAYYGFGTGRVDRPAVSLGGALLKQVFWQHEIVFPYTEWMRRHEAIGICLAGFILASGALALRTMRDGATRPDSCPVRVSAVFGGCYVIGLALSSALARYDFGNVHRVSGPALLFFALAWWSMMGVCFERRGWGKAFIFLALLVIVGKCGWYVSRYRLIAAVKDYRVSVLALDDFIRLSERQSIVLCSGPKDKRYSRGVIYASKTWWHPPVEIISEEFQGTNGSEECAQFDSVKSRWDVVRRGDVRSRPNDRP